jgi:hypothetical protein
MDTRLGKVTIFIIVSFLSCLALLDVGAQEAVKPPTQDLPSGPSAQKLIISEALMCERVENLTPIRAAITFSASVGQVCCFTSFDPVPEPTMIYHRWYHYGELSTQVRLKVYPPKWATYSVVQLRETDKGPWYVEITDQNGRVLDVLRFSITD